MFPLNSLPLITIPFWKILSFTATTTATRIFLYPEIKTMEIIFYLYFTPNIVVIMVKQDNLFLPTNWIVI